MNWLSHIFLSKADVHFQLGNLLADPLKGRPWTGANASYIAGMKFHPKIDVFTDRHPEFKSCKILLADRGRLRGVVLDLAFDYLLSKHWHRFSNMSLPDFVNRFHQAVLAVIGTYPKQEQQVMYGVVQSRLLLSYQNMAGLEQSMQRIDRRLSDRLRAKETAMSYLPKLEQVMPEIEAHYLRFFPQLIAYVSREMNLTPTDHWISSELLSAA